VAEHEIASWQAQREELGEIGERAEDGRSDSYDCQISTMVEEARSSWMARMHLAELREEAAAAWMEDICGTVHQEVEGFEAEMDTALSQALECERWADAMNEEQWADCNDRLILQEAHFAEKAAEIHVMVEAHLHATEETARATRFVNLQRENAAELDHQRSAAELTKLEDEIADDRAQTLISEEVAEAAESRAVQAEVSSLDELAQLAEVYIERAEFIESQFLHVISREETLRMEADAVSDACEAELAELQNSDRFWLQEFLGEQREHEASFSEIFHARLTEVENLTSEREVVVAEIVEETSALEEMADARAREDMRKLHDTMRRTESDTAKSILNITLEGEAEEAHLAERVAQAQSCEMAANAERQFQFAEQCSVLSGHVVALEMLETQCARERDCADERANLLEVSVERDTCEADEVSVFFSDIVRFVEARAVEAVHGVQLEEERCHAFRSKCEMEVRAALDEVHWMSEFRSLVISHQEAASERTAVVESMWDAAELLFESDVVAHAERESELESAAFKQLTDQEAETYHEEVEVIHATSSATSSALAHEISSSVRNCEAVAHDIGEKVAHAFNVTACGGNSRRSAEESRMFVEDELTCLEQSLLQLEERSQSTRIWKSEEIDMLRGRAELELERLQSETSSQESLICSAEARAVAEEEGAALQCARYHEIVQGMVEETGEAVRVIDARTHRCERAFLRYLESLPVIQERLLGYFGGCTRMIESTTVDSGRIDNEASRQ